MITDDCNESSFRKSYIKTTTAKTNPSKGLINLEILTEDKRLG